MITSGNEELSRKEEKKKEKSRKDDLNQTPKVEP